MGNDDQVTNDQRPTTNVRPQFLKYRHDQCSSFVGFVVRQQI